MKSRIELSPYVPRAVSRLLHEIPCAERRIERPSVQKGPWVPTGHSSIVPTIFGQPRIMVEETRHIATYTVLDNHPVTRISEEVRWVKATIHHFPLDRNKME